MMTNGFGPRAWPPLTPDGSVFIPTTGFFTPQQALEARHGVEIRMLQSAYNKMMFFVTRAPGEVSGFGRVSRHGNSFVIDDIMILDQHNTEVSTKITPKTLYRMNTRLRKHGLSLENWLCWWHSHNDFSVGFSETDRDTIENLVNDLYTVSIVANKAFDFRCRVDFYRPARYGIDFLRLKIIPETAPAQIAGFEREMDMAVREAGR